LITSQFIITVSWLKVMPGYIHHIEWCVSDLRNQVQKLVSQYGFQPIGHRIRRIETGFGLKKKCWIVEQVIVQSGDTIFIITQKSRTSSSENQDLDEVKNDEYPILTCCENENHKRDTVFNVALTVGSHLEEIIEKVKRLNGSEQILSPIRSIDDCKLAVIKSCCGNVTHTLLDRKSLFNCFEKVEKSNLYGEPWENRKFATSFMDHVTYVCKKGQSSEILAWYGDIFKMKRFLVNPQESDDGVEIAGDVNMRLTVGEWMSSWLCREEGVQFHEESTDRLNFKLVLAEPLDDDKNSHVQNFLNHHGGPGLQHIGLSTSNVAETVQIMTESGAQFRNPPPTYYKLESKVKEITEAGENIEQCAKLGLLFDTEADFDHQKQQQKSPSLLVQVFTKPVFGPKQDTFFLEVLERRGAKGFGAGNINALAQSIILYQQELEKRLF